MRTKTLLLTAALVAAGVASSMAQSNVYSLNVVGYVNISLTNGFNLISNPLDNSGGGTATSNTLVSTFGTNLLNGTQVFKFSNGGFGSSDAYFTGPGWVGGGTITINPGEGVFVSSPGNTTVTLVGTVVQGPTTNNYPSGFSIVSSQAPLAGGITTALGYSPNNGDQVFFFTPNTQSYSYNNAYFTGPGWVGGEPQVTVGQAFFLDAAASGAWVNNFKVQ